MEPPSDAQDEVPVDQLVEQESEALRERTNSPVKFLLRVFIGVAVVAILVWRTPDRAALLEAIREADLAWEIIGGAALFIGIVVSAARWSAYLDALEIPMRFATTVRLYFVGTFFNAFLPSGIGGDAYKGVRIGKVHGRYTPGFASVFLDRFAGFVALSVIGLAGSLFAVFVADDLGVAGLAALLSVGMLSAALILLFGGERLLGSGRLVKHEGIGGKIRGAVGAIHQAARHREAAGRGYLFGLLFQILVLGYHLAVARALGITGVSVAAMTGLVVIASLATIIPLSPGGLGFREAAYVWTLGRFGVDAHTALAFALLILAILLTTSLVGGLVYVVGGGDVRERR